MASKTKESNSEMLTGKPDTRYSPKEEPMKTMTPYALDAVPDFYETEGSGKSDPEYNPPDLNDLDFPIDHQTMAKTFEESFLPTGDYAWLKDRQLSKTFSEKDKRRGDISPHGRAFYNVFGKVESKDGAYSDYFKLTISPDIRFRKDDKGNDTRKPDGFAENWKRANDLYFLLYAKNAERGTDILKMLLTDQYYLYITRSPRGNFLNGLKKG